MSAKIISNITLKISGRQLLQIYCQDLVGSILGLRVALLVMLTLLTQWMYIYTSIILLAKCLELSKKYLLCINNERG